MTIHLHATDVPLVTDRMLLEDVLEFPHVQLVMTIHHCVTDALVAMYETTPEDVLETEVLLNC